MPNHGARHPDRTVSNVAGEPDRRALIPLAALGLVCLTLFWLAYGFWVRSRFGQKLDQEAFDGAVAGQFARNAADDLLATISIASLVLALLILAVQAILRRRFDLALVSACIIGISAGTAETLKRFVLDRPDLLGPALSAYGNSFPSGHATIAFSLGLAAIVVVPARLRRPAAALAFSIAALDAVLVAAFLFAVRRSSL